MTCNGPPVTVSVFAFLRITTEREPIFRRLGVFVASYDVSNAPVVSQPMSAPYVFRDIVSLLKEHCVAGPACVLVMFVIRFCFCMRHRQVCMVTAV